MHPSAQCAHWAPPLKGRLGYGGGTGFRAGVVTGPYGVGCSAMVVVGADDHIRPWAALSVTALP